MSENSSDRTWVTPADSAETMSGNRSVIPPGWMPVPCSVEPPASQAATRAPVVDGSGLTQPTGVTTFLPARSRATTSSSSGISGE